MMNERIIVYDCLYTFHWFIDPLETFGAPPDQQRVATAVLQVDARFLEGQKADPGHGHRAALRCSVASFRGGGNPLMWLN